MTPAETAAFRLGELAGRKLRDEGIPTPNRLDGRKPALAAAWRRGYMTGQAR